MGFMDDAITSVKRKLGLEKAPPGPESSTTNFISAIKAHGIARSHLFRIHIQDLGQDFGLYATNVNIPSLNVMTKEYRIGNHIIEMPYDFQYEREVNIDFFIDTNHKIYNYFYDWVNRITEHTAFAVDADNASKYPTGPGTQQIRYMGSDITKGVVGYTSDIKIYIVNDEVDNVTELSGKAPKGLLDNIKGLVPNPMGLVRGNDNPDVVWREKDTEEFKLISAYPKKISGISLDTSRVGLSKVTITFTFDRLEYRHMSDAADYKGLEPYQMNALERFANAAAGSIAGKLKTKATNSVLAKVKTKWF